MDMRAKTYRDFYKADDDSDSEEQDEDDDNAQPTDTWVHPN